MVQGMMICQTSAGGGSGVDAARKVLLHWCPVGPTFPSHPQSCGSPKPQPRLRQRLHLQRMCRK